MTVMQGGLYYRTGRSDHDHGPIGQQELEELVREGTVTRETEVRRDGTSVWIRLGRFLNIPDAQLAEAASLPESEWTRLMDEFVIESGPTSTKPEAPARAPVPAEPPAPKVERWCCRVYGKEVGPMEVSLLRAMAEQGQISPMDRVRRDGEAKWVLADAVPGLFDGLATKDEKPRANMGISPQRFSSFVPKKKKKKPPPKPAEPKPVATKPAPAPATPANPQADSAKSPASSAAAASSPAASSPAAPAHAGAPSSAAGPAKPYSTYSSPAQPSFQRPAYTPPRPARKRTSDRDWSFSLPSFGDGDVEFKQIAIGFVVFVLVVGVWWAVGGLGLIYGLIFE